jgi:hypothetical protein
MFWLWFLLLSLFMFLFLCLVGWLGMTIEGKLRPPSAYQRMAEGLIPPPR